MVPAPTLSSWSEMPPNAIRIYTASGGWQDVAVAGGTHVYEQPAAPSPAVVGDMWIDTDDSMPVGGGGPLLVASLPASPTDGQEVYFLADDANGVVWHLRYRAASASPYKWECVGGPPLSAQSGTSASISSTTPVAPSSPCQITLPLGGDYIIDLSTNGNLNATNSYAYIVPTVGGVSIAGETFTANGPTALWATWGDRYRISGRAAGQTVSVWVRVSGGAYAPSQINLLLEPVRVG